jgi:hypothetical protein
MGAELCLGFVSLYCILSGHAFFSFFGTGFSFGPEEGFWSVTWASVCAYVAGSIALL